MLKTEFNFCISIVSFANTKMTIEEIISNLDLKPHPEGGFYRRFFESDNMIDTPMGQRLE